MNSEKKLGDRIQLLRQHYRMDQQDLADLLNLSLSHVYNLEQGLSKELSQATIRKLREDLQVSIPWLLHGEGKMFEKAPKTGSKSGDPTSPTEHALYQHLLKTKDLLIQSQSEEIKALKAHIAYLEKELAKHTKR